MLADSLEEFGHKVRTARAADEAIELLGHDSPIEVLVTDITLPGGMSGSDLVRKARELMPDLKILTISGNANEEAIRTSHVDRCAFLPKPFRLSELNRAVVELL
jgi:DNA-binding NtrC family response regulator